MEKYKKKLKDSIGSNIMNDSSVSVYYEKLKNINMLIAQLQKKLKGHEKQFKTNPKNWGFPGDLGHVEDLLMELTGFIK